MSTEQKNMMPDEYPQTLRSYWTEYDELKAQFDELKEKERKRIVAQSPELAAVKAEVDSLRASNADLSRKLADAATGKTEGGM